MFSFFALPKAWLNGPIIRSELTHLHKFARLENRWSRWFKNIITFLACLSAMLPLIVFMTDQVRTYVLMFFMILTIYLVHLQVVLRTLTLASHTIARETETGNWDNLVLTGIDVRYIIIGKWWAVMRCVWKDYLIAAILKCSIAIALSQYLHNVYIGSCYRHLLGGLCYWSNFYPAYPTSPDGNYLWIPYGAVFAVIAFAFAEAGLLTAMSICTCIVTRHRATGIAWVVVIRGLIIVLAISAFVLLGIRSRKLSEVPDQSSVHLYMTVWERQHIVGTLQVAVSTLADSGTIIAADLMRRVWGYDHLIIRVALASLMLLVFVFLTRISLQIAQHFAVKNHALRPPD